MRRRKWDPESLDYWEWSHGDYWPLIRKNEDEAAEIVGFAVICPKEWANGSNGIHRHHFLFKDYGTEKAWKFTNSTGDLVHSPKLPCVTTLKEPIFYFQVIKGQIEVQGYE